MTEERTRKPYKRGPKVSAETFDLVRATKERFPNMISVDIAGYLTGTGQVRHISRATVARILQVDSFSAYECLRDDMKARRYGTKDCTEARKNDGEGEQTATNNRDDKPVMATDFDRVVAASIVLITDTLTKLTNTVNRLLEALGVDDTNTEVK